jgi:hypothetical protein
MKRQVLCAWLLLAFDAGGTLAHPAEHGHIRVVIDIRASDIGATGDVLGLYAAELVACDGRLSLADPTLPTSASVSQRTVESIFAVISGTAHANHRERLDGPAAREFMQPVALDRAGRTVLGELDAATGSYCHVRLTLARLPSTATRPALPHSLRLSGETGGVLALDYRETLQVLLTKPWRASGGSIELTVRLRPRTAQALIPFETDDMGAVSQRVVTLLSKQATAEIKLR